MIKLEDKHRFYTNRNSSKGNQLKWVKDNVWYKADYLGYEALAEYVISALLEKTNVSDFVKYDLGSIDYSGRIYKGCYSRSMLQIT